jgi:hypothetical protein
MHTEPLVNGVEVGDEEIIHQLPFWQDLTPERLKGVPVRRTPFKPG